MIVNPRYISFCTQYELQVFFATFENGPEQSHNALDEQHDLAMMRCKIPRIEIRANSGVMFDVNSNQRL